MIDSLKQSALYQYAVEQNRGSRYHAIAGAIAGFLGSFFLSPPTILLLVFGGSVVWEIAYLFIEGTDIYTVDDSPGHTPTKRWFLDSCADVFVAVACAGIVVLVMTYIAGNHAQLLM